MKEYIHGGDVYRHPDVLDFSANINPLGPPKEVIRAAKESMEQMVHYPDACKEELKTALSNYEQVPEEWLICGNGAAELIFTLVYTLRPKRALLQAPTFAEYEQALRCVDCEISYADSKMTYEIGREFLHSLTMDPDIVFLCNPNNPTGLLIDPDLLLDIVKICGKRNVILVVDECFIDFVDAPKKHSLLKYLASYPHVFLLKAFTKRYAMAGLRLGYGICADSALLAAMEERTQPWNVSAPAQAAGIAALKEQAYVEQSRDIIKKERAYLKKELNRLGYACLDSQANYIFFKGEPDLYDQLLKEKILIRDCSNYKALTKGHYRIAVRLHEENERFIQALSKIQEAKEKNRWQKQS